LRFTAQTTALGSLARSIAYQVLILLEGGSIAEINMASRDEGFISYYSILKELMGYNHQFITEILMERRYFLLYRYPDRLSWRTDLMVKKHSMNKSLAKTPYSVHYKS
jgi:hypothetical protein